MRSLCFSRLENEKLESTIRGAQSSKRPHEVRSKQLEKTNDGAQTAAMTNKEIVQDLLRRIP
jgi:hypothetical protein